MKIKETIVVEGKDDVAAVKRAVDAHVIITQGLGFPKGTREKIKQAGVKTGIIVLTDPDFAGEKIRREVEKIVPDCKHAYITREKATKEGNVGVENAEPKVIQEALIHVMTGQSEPGDITMKDMVFWGLSGGKEAKKRRLWLSERLNMGYANAKQMKERLNYYGIDRETILKTLRARDES